MTAPVLRTHFLTGFPSLASCPLCMVYTDRHLATVCGQDVLTAAARYHDSAHMNDPFDEKGYTWTEAGRTPAPEATRTRVPRQASAATTLP
ncbi:MAG TPA: hypothetical protein VHN80_14425 [Kineosporiaceae bacterium]|jgi:hypothetical protein|nr:hypothetical protein [Kineosporiaceae bacterium]